jgi:xanthine dehydrogenase accessory factor
MPTFFEKLNELAASNVPFVSVIIVDAQGSVPQDVGAKMLVTRDGLFFGTVGGGKVEKRAIDEAKEMLSATTPEDRTKFVNWALDRDIGMTCGGSLKLFFESFNLHNWKIVIFGAGHVANAIVNLLTKIDCRIVCIDSRQEWLDKLPISNNLEKRLSAEPPNEVAGLDDDSFVLLMTMGHTSDKPILLEILKQDRKFPYLGVIGSKAKAARLKNDVVEAGLPERLQSSFYCPVGLNVGSNHPQEIAVSVVAQLLQERDYHRSGMTRNDN